MPKNIRSLTLRIPEEIHHKLKIIAAIQNTTLVGAICHLVKKENISNMEQTPVLKSLLYSAADLEEAAQEDRPEQAGPGKEPAPKAKRKPQIDI